MQKYTEHELLRLAKRFHNTKRTYLLVDPLQGKHIPVKPSDALNMLHSLGQIVKNAYPDTKLVIGFAETATAVGMAVAEEIADDCVYIHTTRECIPQEPSWIEFLEEHSHATEQKLAASDLQHRIENTNTIVFVDDEISTGKTILNFIEQLKKEYPAIESKKLVAASIINRVTGENNKKLVCNGIESIQLLKLEDTDFTEDVKKFAICGAGEVSGNIIKGDLKTVTSNVSLMNPRLGVNTGEYKHNCQAFADDFFLQIDLSDKYQKILVLGTEECMYPAIILGESIEKHIEAEVYTHSTTRSPIGICKDEGYPITSGYKIKSLYDHERVNFIYNLGKYDLVIIVTDSVQESSIDEHELISALYKEGNKEIVLYRG